MEEKPTHQAQTQTLIKDLGASQKAYDPHKYTYYRLKSFTPGFRTMSHNYAIL